MTSVIVKDFPRNAPRQMWKWYYRQIRIATRESRKAFVDMIVYGSGAVRIGKDVPDFIRHVPIKELHFD
jgi:hypothetical protein